MNRIHIIHLLVVVLTLLSPIVSAKTAQWPNWRGPLATGVVTEGNPPIEWSETKNIQWKIAINSDGSNSTPIIWGDKLIYQTAVKLGGDDNTDNPEPPQPPAANTRGQGRNRGGRAGRGGFGGNQPAPKSIYQFNLVCRNRNTGKLMWSKTVAEAVPAQRHHRDHGFVSFSPVTDGKRVWAHFGPQGLFCYDLNGNQKWKAELGAYNIRAQFGAGGSPTLVGDLIVVVKDHEDQSFIVAYNKTTGDQVWKKDRDERTNWTTPFVATVKGRQQLIVNGTNHVYAYDAQTGDIQWETTGQTDNVIPTPVIYEDIVYCTSGFRGSKLQAIRLGSSGDLMGTDAIVWEADKNTPYVPSPLIYQGKLYVCSGNKATITCYDAVSGKAHYTAQDLPELSGIYASPIGVNNRVYFTGRKGKVCVLKNTDSLEILATNTLEDNFDCSPVVIGDTLYLKGKKNLYCIAR